jgi:polar amino acid transport system substrate-binding protein
MRRSITVNRYKLKSFVIIFVWICNFIPAFAQSETTDSTIQSSKKKVERKTQSPVWQVGILRAPPFSFKDSKGEWVGISVILWRLVANDIGLKYKFEELGLPELLDGVSHGDLDAGIGPLTITAEREKRFDFTHSFFNTGLGVVVKKEPDTTIVSILRHIMRGERLRTIGVILLTLALIAVLIFICERRYAKVKPDKANEARSNFWSSLWWSLVILIGKNDRHPASVGGRILALSWMVISLIIFASLTALITSALTVTELKVKINSPNDLVRVRLATVKSSTSEEFLNRERINFRSAANITDAFKLLAESKTDAIVYDKPLLRYLVKKNYANDFEVLSFTFEPQSYGFAIKDGKQELEGINRSILARTQASYWADLIYRHLGK